MSTKARPTTVLALSSAFALAVGLTGCAAAGDTEAAPNPSNASSPAPADSSLPVTDGASAGLPDNVNCVNIFDDTALLTYDLEGWGLKEQAVVTSGNFVLPLPDDATREPDSETTAPSELDRPVLEVELAVSCSVHGKSLNTGAHYWIVDPVDFSKDAFVSSLENVGYQKINEVSGVTQLTYVRSPGGSGAKDEEGRQVDWAAVTDEWFVVGQGINAEIGYADRVTNNLTDADANDFVNSQTVSQSCSMFFEPSAYTGDGTGVGLRYDTALTALESSEALTVTTTPDYEGNIANVVCEQIKWQDGADGASLAPAAGEPVATNDECRIWEHEEGFLVDCGEAGSATVRAPIEVAQQIVPPKFRSLTDD